MLSVLQRQQKLKDLGFYTGAIDGIEGVKTKAAYKALQDKYFTRAVDRDSKYGNDTDILLRNAWLVWRYALNFKLEEFRCNCGQCTGYPAVLNEYLCINIQSIRELFGTTKITSCLRCKKHNDSLKGASKNSRHLTGKAVDVIVPICKTEAGRVKVMNYWRTLKNNRYCYCNIGGSHKHMGSAVHCDVR